MTNKQIDKLAELIADKLIAKQKEYDKAIVEWNKILERDPDFSTIKVSVKK